MKVSDVPEGGLLVQILAISADPYLRGMIRSTGAIKAGNPMFGFVSGKIIVSHHSDWKADDLFGANLPFSSYQIVTPEKVAKMTIWKLTGLIDEN